MSNIEVDKDESPACGSPEARLIASLPPPSDRSVYARLAHAIADKDFESVDFLLTSNQDFVFSGTFMDMSWPERVIRSFDQRVADRCRLAGLECNKNYSGLLKVVSLTDQPLAFDWLTSDPRVARLLARKSRSKYLPGETEYEDALTWPFCEYPSVKLALHHLDNPAIQGVLSYVCTYVKPLVNILLVNRDWSNIAKIFEVLDHGVGVDKNPDFPNCDPPFTRFITHLVRFPSPEILEIEEGLSSYPLALAAWNRHKPFSIQILDPFSQNWLSENFPAYHDLEKVGLPTGRLYPTLKTNDILEALLLSGSSALVPLTKNKDVASKIVQLLNKQDVGVYSLAVIACMQAKDVASIMIDLAPLLVEWRGPGGRNVGQVLMEVKPSVLLAKNLIKVCPDWVVSSSVSGSVLDSLSTKHAATASALKRQVLSESLVKNAVVKKSSSGPMSRM